MYRGIITSFLILIFVGLLHGQGIQVQGTVVDEKGEALIGVNILIEGSSSGVVTDINGNYSVMVNSAQDVLVFSYVGYEMKREIINNRSTINVVMMEISQVLETVMVVAYGTATKEKITGSIDVVDKGTIENRPTASITKTLQGAVPGLMVTSSSGQPGAGATVRIRGIGSLSAGSSPLYVLDGVPMAGSISDINPNDIESISVLKDAAASSLYGSRAANGVILITTKQGSASETRISFNTQVGSSRRISDGYPLMNSTQYYEHTWMGLYNQSILDGNSIDVAKTYANDQVENIVGFNPFGLDDPLDDNGKLIPGTEVVTNTDWRDEIFKRGIVSSHNLNIIGGNDKTKVYLSTGYFSDNGNVLSSNYQRGTSKINVTQQINKVLSAGINAHLSYSITNAPPSGTGGANPVRSADVINAASPVFNADGSYNWENTAVFDFNPIGLSYLDTYKYKTKRTVLNTYIILDILPQLTFKTTASVDNSGNQSVNYYNPDHGNGAGVNGRSSMANSDNIFWNFQNLLTFKKGKERIVSEYLLGHEVTGNDFSLLSAGVTNFSVPDHYDLVWGSEPDLPASYTTAWRMISYFGRVKFDIDYKYFLDASVRTDGSSRFGRNNKYGLFYSFGAGWRISDESWMPKFSWLNSTKLRASYGTSGNNSIGNYASLGLYGSGANYAGSPGLSPVQLPNNDLSWEKIASFNVGIDAQLLKKIDFSAEYYSRNSDGLLYALPLSSAKGFGSILTNLGAMSNYGYELSLNYLAYQTEETSIDLGINFSSNQNKIISLDSEKIISGTKLIEEGSSVYQFYLKEWAGVNPDNGTPMWYVNEDSDDVEDNALPSSSYEHPDGSKRMVTSVYNDAERVRMGTALPKYFGGLNLNMKYKQFDLNCNFYYSVGAKMYNVDYATNMHDGVSPGTNLAVDALNSWTPNNRFTDVPRYVINNTDQGEQMSSRFLESANYVRLRNVTLNYVVPQILYSKWNINSVRIFLSGENLLTFSKYKGYDPEGAINGTTNNNIPGVKVITTGLKIDL